VFCVQNFAPHKSFSLRRLLVRTSYFAHGKVAKYCNECLSVGSHISNTTLPNFWCTLPVSVTRSFSDGVAISYVLPVLWMTSCFHTMCFMVRRVYSLLYRECNSQKYCFDSNQISKINKYTLLCCAPRAKSAMYDYLVR